MSRYFIREAFSTVILDAHHRCYVVFVAMCLPTVAAAPGYPNLDSSQPNYYDFALEPSSNATVVADATYFRPGNMQFGQWSSRARKIRGSSTSTYCSGNLSLALGEVGAAYQASASGSTTLLTLLPTAGALIGAPAKELWVLYKLCPLAGFLSSVLALGGSIVPHQVGAYANLEDFSYSDMPSTNAVDGLMKRRPSGRTWSDLPDTDPHLVAEHFADQVFARAMDSRGSARISKVALGICGLIACILLICGACIILSAGSIVVWWCQADNWAFTWYGSTIVASILENYANAPFVKDWVMRVSRAPRLHVSPDAPWVVSRDLPSLASVSEQPSSPYASKSENATVNTSLIADYTPRHSVLAALKDGYNTQGEVIMDDNAPWSASKDAFYVIISRDGVRKGQTALRLFSKFVSVTTYVVSTALFASSTLLQLQPAIIVMALVLGAGIFGRVTAMWMSAVMMRDRPVLHRIVKTNKEADVFIEAILRKDGIVCEVLGHVVVNGRCVMRRSRITWSTVFGVLARPFDVSRIAMASSA